MFFPVKMTVYENSQLPNTFMLIDRFAIYFHFHRVVSSFFLTRMAYDKVCFLNIKR